MSIREVATGQHKIVHTHDTLELAKKFRACRNLRGCGKVQLH